MSVDYDRPVRPFKKDFLGKYNTRNEKKFLLPDMSGFKPKYYKAWYKARKNTILREKLSIRTRLSYGRDVGIVRLGF